MTQHDDTYTGHVTPDGPAGVRELPALTIRKLGVGGFGNNAYLLTSRANGAQLLVDAAAEPERILELVGGVGGQGLDTVVTTHQHHDHVGALAEVVAATGARTVAGTDDADALPVPVDVRVEHGDTVTFGDVTLDVVHLRGHTPGSIALAYARPRRRRSHPPLHRRQPLPRWHRQHEEPRPELRLAHRGRHDPRLRRLRRRHVVLPRPR